MLHDIAFVVAESIVEEGSATRTIVNEMKNDTVLTSSLDFVDESRSTNSTGKAVVGVGSSMAASAMMESVLAAGAIGGPLGFILAAGAAYCASSTAKAVYEEL